jgi:hypothetical protein
MVVWRGVLDGCNCRISSPSRRLHSESSQAQRRVCLVYSGRHPGTGCARAARLGHPRFLSVCCLASWERSFSFRLDPFCKPLSQFCLARVFLSSIFSFCSPSQNPKPHLVPCSRWKTKPRSKGYVLQLLEVQVALIDSISFFYSTLNLFPGILFFMSQSSKSPKITPSFTYTSAQTHLPAGCHTRCPACSVLAITLATRMVLTDKCHSQRMKTKTAEPQKGTIGPKVPSAQSKCPRPSSSTPIHETGASRSS